MKYNDIVKIKRTTFFNVIVFLVFIIFAYLVYSSFTVTSSRVPDATYSCQQKSVYVTQSDCNRVDYAMGILFVLVVTGLAHGFYVNRKIIFSDKD